MLTNAQPYITSVGTLSTLDVTGNVGTGNVTGTTGAFTNVTGTLQTASQTNITAVGTLGALSVTGNATTGNVSGTTGTFTNIRGALLDASQTAITAVGTLGALSVTGNVTAGNVSSATGTFTNVRGLLLDPAQTNITSVGTLTGLTVSGNITANVVSTLIYGGILTASSQPNITAVGTLVSLSVTGNVSTGNVSGATGTFTDIRGAILDASQTAITTVGTLTGLTVTGATTAANISANGLTAKDINVTHANIGADAIVVGNVSSANVSGFKGTFTQVEGTLLTNAQPFITSIGTLPSLTVTGNIGADNLNANTSNITGNSVTLNDLVTGTTDTNNLTVRGVNAFLSNVEARANLNVANVLTVLGANLNAFGARISTNSIVVTNELNANSAYISGVEDAVSSVSGAIVTPGGISAVKQIYSGGNVITDGNVVAAGNVIAGTNVRVGGDMYFFGTQPSVDFITNRANISLFDGTATTISIGGEATTVNIGAISGFGNTTIRNDLTLKGGLFPEGGFGEVGIGNVIVNNDLSAAGSIYAPYIQIANRTITGNGFSNARTTSTNINSGALQVRGGTGISGNLVVGAPSNSNSTVYINSVATTTSNSTGALQVAGGISTKGNLWVEGEATIIGNVNFTAFLAASINGTPIGNATPSTGVFTALATSNSTPSIRPSINFDFANNPNLPQALTYTRTGPATYYDNRGNLRVAPAYAPRFTYDPTTGVCLGLMIEESRQNLYRESNSFANTAVYIH